MQHKRLDISSTDNTKELKTKLNELSLLLWTLKGYGTYKVNTEVRQIKADLSGCAV
jgi:hypothetical protein